MSIQSAYSLIPKKNMRILKKIIYGILFLILVLAILAFFATRFINPNDYKSKISSIVKEKTGRTLTIKGDMELSFFPWVGVRVRDVHLSNASGFQPADFASISQADVKIKLLPLLSKQVEADQITLTGLTLNLAKNKQGISNWQGLAIPAKKNDVLNNSKQNTQSTQPSKNKLNFNLQNIDIQDSSISWVDAQKGQNIQLKNLQLKTEFPGIGKSFPMEMSTQIDGSKPNLKGILSFKSTFLLNETKIDATNTTLIFQKDVATNISLKIPKWTLDKTAQTLQIPNTNLAYGDIEANLNVKATHILDSPRLEGNVQIPAWDANIQQIAGHFIFDQKLLTIDPLTANLYKGTLREKVTVNLVGDVPASTMNGTISKVDMTGLIKSGRLAGFGDVTNSLTFQGMDKPSIIRTLNGNIQFSIQQGALTGMNIPYEVERAIALFKRQPPPSAPDKNQTDFETFKGTGLIQNGVFSNPDLLIQAPKFKATGDGTADLNTEQLNYSLKLIGMHTIVDANGQSIPEERQIPFPVKITGTFDKPVLRPDVQTFLMSEAGQKVVEKAKETLQSGGDFLRQLLQKHQ